MAQNLYDPIVDDAPLFDRPTLIFSDANCRLDGGIFDRVPLLLDTNGKIIGPPSSWLRSLVVNARSWRTVHQYATSICLYWSFLNDHPLDWDSPSDATLRLWRNRLAQGHVLRERSREKATINAHLECVMRFYRWAQEDGHCVYVIGETPPNSKPYPIRLIRQSSRKHSRLTSDLLYKIPRKPTKPIPTSSEMEQLYIALGGPGPTNARNCLMCKWATGSGLRRTEIISISIDDLPPYSKCIDMLENDKIYFLEVTGKNGTIREVPVLPEVLLETHQFILDERNQLLGDNENYSERAIFISGRGEALNEQHFSRLISSAFRSFGNRKLTFHRLRARFASRLVQYLRLEEESRVGRAGVNYETILERAAQLLGHSNLESLRFYLNVDLDTADMAVKLAMKSSSSILAKAPALTEQWAPTEN